MISKEAHPRMRRNDIEFIKKININKTNLFIFYIFDLPNSLIIKDMHIRSKTSTTNNIPFKARR